MRPGPGFIWTRHGEPGPAGASAYDSQLTASGPDRAPESPGAGPSPPAWRAGFSMEGSNDERIACARARSHGDQRQSSDTSRVRPRRSCSRQLVLVPSTSQRQPTPSPSGPARIRCRLCRESSGSPRPDSRPYGAGVESPRRSPEQMIVPGIVRASRTRATASSRAARRLVAPRAGRWRRLRRRAPSGASVQLYPARRRSSRTRPGWARWRPLPSARNVRTRCGRSGARSRDAVRGGTQARLLQRHPQ